MAPHNLDLAAKILHNLTHDLRQSLGTIEVSTYVLDRSLTEADVPAREHIRIIERQVEAASALLCNAMEAMRALTDQPAVESSRDLTKSTSAGLR